MKRLACFMSCAAVGLGAFAADYHWTGAAGDHLWSTAENWADSAGNPVAAPTEGVQYSYNFTDYPDGLVVTQDIDVVTGLFAVENTVADGAGQLANITWVSASGKKLKIVKEPGNSKARLFANKGARLVLECDCSGDSSSDGIVKCGAGTLALRLKAANTANRQLQILREDWSSGGCVELLEGGVDPLVGIEVAGGVLQSRKDATVTALYVGQSGSDGLAKIGKTVITNATLAVGWRNASTSSTNHLYTPVFARGGRLVYQSERLARARALPLGGTLELDRADLTLDAKPLTAVRWTFEDPDNPIRDAFGNGSRMLAPNGMPSVVDDPVRGKVLQFDGVKYFKGPDANAGLDGLQFQSTNSPYTVAFWFKPDASCDQLAKLVFWGTNAGKQAMALRLNVKTDATKPLMFTTWDDNQTPTSSVNVFDGAWHHVAVTHDGDCTFYLYLDGVLLADGGKNYTSHVDNYRPQNQNFYIARVFGGWEGTGANSYKGLMDDFVVGGYCLDAGQVVELYRGGLKATLGVAGVKTRSSGSLYLPSHDRSVGALSGEGVLGGVEVYGAGGSTLEVGAEGTSGLATFKAQLRGSDMTLVKSGADYVQEFAGTAANVTNLVVREGTMTVRHPLVRKGLVLHYGFDSAETLTNDDGVAGLPLVIGGNGTVAQIADGVKGGAVRLAGGSWLNTGDNCRPATFPFGNKSFTISVWIRPTADACSRKTPFVCWGKGADKQLVYLRFETATELRFSNYSEDLTVANVPNLADGNWHHVVAVYDAVAKGKYVYVDGVCRASKVGNVPALNIGSDKALRLGQKWDDTLAYAGDLDEFMVFDEPWSAQDAADEFAQKRPSAVAVETRLPKPLARWTFDDETNVGADSSGNGYDLTPAGTVAVESKSLACGKAVRIADDTGYLKLADMPAAFPKGSNAVSIVCRILADRIQNTDSYATVLTWGDSGNWSKGKLIKVGMLKSTGQGPRITVGTKTCGDATSIETYTSVRAYRSDVGTARLRWLTVGITYSRCEEKSGSVFTLYFDGEQVDRAVNVGFDLAAQGFAVGAMSDGTSHFRGLIDEVQIYDRPLSAGEMRLVAEQLANSGELPAALPKKPSVTVAAGATLNISANESVASLSGAGSVNVAPLATLAVGSSEDFTGTFAGEGTLAPTELKVVSLASLPVLATPGALSFGATGTLDWAKGAVPSGWVTVATAAKGILGVENLSGWTSTGRTDIRFKLSADGKSLLARIKPGIVLIFR